MLPCSLLDGMFLSPSLSLSLCVCVCVRVCACVCVQVMDFSQHHLELVSKEEYAKPPDRQPRAKDYGLVKKKIERYISHICPCFMWR